jgi:hypothetical protein
LYANVKNSPDKIVDAYKMSTELKLGEVFHPMVAELLEENKCLLLNRKTNKLEKSMKVLWHTEMLGNSLTDGAILGRIYFLDGHEFFQIVDGNIN